MPGDTLYHLLRLYKLKYISLVHSFNRLYHDDEDFHYSRRRQRYRQVIRRYYFIFWDGRVGFETRVLGQGSRGRG
jgi:hypothetical protein